MADDFKAFASSAVTRALVPAADTIPRSSSPAGSDDFDGFMSNGSSGRLQVASSQKFNPDEAASHVEVSRKVGMPADVVQRNPDIWKSKDENIKADDFSQKSPNAAAWAGQIPQNYHMISDDLANVSGHEAAHKEYNVLRSMNDAIMSGLNQFNQTVFNLPATAYDLAALPQNLLAKISGRPDLQVSAPESLRLNPAQKFWGDQIKAYQASSPETTGDPLEDGKHFAAHLVAGFPSLFGGLAVAGLTGGVGGATFFGATGASSADKEGVEAKADPAAIAQHAALSGVVNAGIQNLSFGAAKIFESTVAKAASQYGKQTAIEFAKSTIASMTKAASGMVIQGPVMRIASDASEYLNGINPDAFKDFFHQMATEAAMGVASGATAGLAEHMTGTLAGRMNAAKATTDATHTADNYDAIGKLASESKLRQRSRDSYQAMHESLNPDGEIYIPLEVLDQHLASGDESAVMAAQKIGIGEAYQKAKYTGTDMRIKQSEWTSKTADLPIYSAVRDDIKYRVNDLSLNESKQLQTAEEPKAAPAEKTPGPIEKFVGTLAKSLGFNVPEPTVAGPKIQHDPMPDLHPLQQQAEKRLGDIVNSPEAWSKYQSHPETAGGKVFDTDIARELLPDYASGPEGATLHTASTQRPAGAFVKHHFEEALAKKPTGAVMILGGGGGSGKSTVSREALSENIQNADAVLDTTLANKAKASSAIEMSKKSGRDVTVAFVYRPAEAAAEGAAKRFEKTGRYVPSEVLAADHVKALENFLELSDKYKNDPDVTFIAYDNSGSEPVRIGIDDLRKLSYVKEGESSKEAIERLAPKIKEVMSHVEKSVSSTHGAAFQAVAGNAGVGQEVPGGSGREGYRGSSEGGDRPRIPDDTGGNGPGGIPGEVPASIGSDSSKLPGYPESLAGPHPEIAASARAYHEAAGIPYRRQAEWVRVDESRAKRLADAYEEMKHDPENPVVKRAYKALAKETVAQFHEIEKLGIKFEKIPEGAPDPYPQGPRQAIEDVHQNKHLWYFPSISGFGTETKISDNPLLEPSGVMLNGEELPVNDVFRIVHDIYGHVKEGNSFGARGEENAWQSHVRMYSPEAALAMTSETRGQNSWVNFHPKSEANRTKPGSVYADQKTGLLPEWAMTEGLAQDQPEISPSVRAKIRSISTSQVNAIADEQALGGMDPEALRKAGMDSKEVDKYVAAVSEAREFSRNTLEKQLLEQEARKKKATWKSERASAEKDMAELVDTQPEYLALRVLQEGEPFTTYHEENGVSIPETMGKVKLSKADIVSAYGEDVLAGLPRPYVYSAKGGIHPDIAASMFGFNDGSSMLKAITEATPRKQMIQALTDEHMLTQHGDLLAEGKVPQAALDALHNEKSLRVGMMELKFMAEKKRGSLNSIAKDISNNIPKSEHFTDMAQKAIASEKIRDLQPVQYQRAEAKWGHKSVAALVKGDWNGAFDAKYQQILNHEQYKAAVEAKEFSDKGLSYLKKFEKASVREKISGSFVEQIDGLLGRFDLRRSVTGAAIDRQRQSLADFSAKMSKQGYEPQVPEYFLNEMNRTSYKELPVEDFRGLVNSVKSIEYIGREQKKAIFKGEQLELGRVVDLLKAKMDERGERFTKADLLEPPKAEVDGYWKAFSHWFMSKARLSDADLQPQEFKFNRYDMHEIDGPFREALLDPMLAANYRKVDMTREVSRAAEKVGEALGKDWQNSLYDQVPNETLLDPDLGGQMKITRGRMLGIARHVGNESNLGKLALGYGWTVPDIREFLNKNMTAKDWAATQAHWDAFDPLWKEAEAMIRRLGGVPPAKIQAQGFTTPQGIEIRGGYSPIDYDPLRSKLAASKGEFSLEPGEELGKTNVYKATTTRNGSLNERSGYTDRVSLDFHSSEARIRDTIHDLAYREALINASKLVNDEAFREKFQLTYGKEEYQAMSDWLTAIRDTNAIDSRNRGFEKAMQYTRQGVVLTGIGYRLSTVLKHGGSAALKSLGYLGNAEGAKYFGARVARMASGHMSEDISGAQEKFEEIRTRMLQMDRDYQEGTGSMYKPETWKEKNNRFGHMMVAWSDALSAVPTAWAAYDLAKTSGVPVSMGGTGRPMTEPEAVRYANSIVRQAHGSALEVTRSNFLQSRGMKGLFGTLYGFMNNSYGQTADMLDKSVSGGRFQNKPAVAARLFATMLIPAVWAGYLSGGGPGDDENTASWGIKALAGEVGGMVPFVRDAVALLEHGHGGTIAPIQAITDAIFSGRDLIKEANGDETKLIQELFNAVGEWSHIAGLGQLGHVLQYARDVSNGNHNPENAAQATKEAIIGGAR